MCVHENIAQRKKIGESLNIFIFLMQLQQEARAFHQRSVQMLGLDTLTFLVMIVVSPEVKK